ncbi:hypothetical protein V8G54_017390 [Vigna mungo]|uniref:Integrase catalytic domain-containing protein n=1 Tax=Vigna mungo TaxID=3915 RepID=A0AAQ3NN40_VIGMU
MNLTGLRNNVVKFNGLNYADWSEQIQFQLGVLDLDMAIVMDEMSPAITETSTSDKKSLYEAWHRSNRLERKAFHAQNGNAKEFMKMIKEYSQSDITDKSIVGTLMRMDNIAARLKLMGMEVNESFLVQFIMNYLPPEFGQFQEGRLKKMRHHSIHLTTHEGASFSKVKSGKKNKKDKAPMKVNKGGIQKDQNVSFARKLIIDTGYCLNLEKCLYVPGCARNLISVAKLDCLGFNFRIENGIFHLYKLSYYYGSGTLLDGLYRLNLDVNFSESLFNIEHVVDRNSSSGKECSAFLWHKRLGHISKERMLRLVKNEILPQLDFDGGKAIDRKVKVVRSDRGGEYYGKTDESGQCPGPFAKYLESRGICAQYTMSGTPQQNVVVERWNRTLMDMVPGEYIPPLGSHSLRLGMAGYSTLEGILSDSKGLAEEEEQVEVVVLE